MALAANGTMRPRDGAWAPSGREVWTLLALLRFNEGTSSATYKHRNFVSHYEGKDNILFEVVLNPARFSPITTFNILK